MQIRKATVQDLSAVLDIYERARGFMEETGNPTQWGKSYPSPECVRSDIQTEHLYVLEKDGALHGVFAFFPEGDAAYDTFPDKWINPLPYAAIHRVASAGKERGVLSAIVAYCLSQRKNLKIDTHKDNRVMQKALEKQGFVFCGVANIPDVGERMLYQLNKETT